MRYLDTHRCRANDKMSAGNSIFVEASSADEQHILGPIATGSFPVTAADKHTVTTQRSDNSVKKVLPIRILRASTLQEKDNNVKQHQLYHHSRNLDSTRHRGPHVLAPQGSTQKEGVRVANLPISMTLGHRSTT